MSHGSWRRTIATIAVGVATAAATTLTAGTAASAGESTAPGGDIVGGSEVKNAPSWSAVLGFDDTDMWCSGSLVASQWVLTAKHCGGDLSVVRIGSKYTESGGTLVDLTTSVTHDRYDVRLYRLESPVDNAPVDISTSTPKAGVKATLYGHGQTCPNNGCPPLNDQLKSTTTTVTSTSECGGIRGTGELCMDTSVTSTDCYGDSGGAAIANGRLVGIDSRSGTGPGGQTCGSTNSIYTDAATVRSWIESTTSD